MELVVDNVNGKIKEPSMMGKIKAGIMRDNVVTICLDSEAIFTILTEHFWKESKWLDKHYCWCEMRQDPATGHISLIYNKGPKNETSSN